MLLRVSLLMACLFGTAAFEQSARVFAETQTHPVESNDGVPPFYVPADPNYSIVDSSLDSIRFTLNRTVKPNTRGYLVSVSSFVNPDGEPMLWHDFGPLEGPGWATNAIGGAHEIYRFGTFLKNAEWQQKALRILDHILEDGFIDRKTGFIRGYRHTQTGEFCLNYRHNSDWFCPGAMAKNAFQLLVFADELGDDPRAARMRRIAVNCAQWIHTNVKPVSNSWFPRRVTATGDVYRKDAGGTREDRFWQTSADGLFILQLQAALTERNLAEFRKPLADKAALFVRRKGFFGSINQDTYDKKENVAYAVAFRTLLLASRVLKDEALRRFAYDTCLIGLEQFRIREERNGVATTGLLIMERSWDTAYLWENAEAALAYFEAAQDLRTEDPRRSRQYLLDGLTILRAIAKHHYGPHGFLTEGVDWNNFVGQRHHIGGKRFGAIQYTEPFLNNLHIVEPTLFYLEQFATRTASNGMIRWRDIENNVILKRPVSK